MKLYGLLRCGMGLSFQKNQHPNTNLKVQQTQKAAPLIKTIADLPGEAKSV
jgi:hypothetical protein